MTDEPEEEIREIRSPNERILNAIDILVGNSTDARWESAQKAKESLLREQAKRIVAQIQGTMGLEGQALDQQQIEEMIERTYQELRDE